ADARPATGSSVLTWAAPPLRGPRDGGAVLGTGELGQRLVPVPGPLTSTLGELGGHRGLVPPGAVRSHCFFTPLGFPSSVEAVNTALHRVLGPVLRVGVVEPHPHHHLGLLFGDDLGADLQSITDQGDARPHLDRCVRSVHVVAPALGGRRHVLAARRCSLIARWHGLLIRRQGLIARRHGLIFGVRPIELGEGVTEYHDREEDGYRGKSRRGTGYLQLPKSEPRGHGKAHDRSDQAERLPIRQPHGSRLAIQTISCTANRSSPIPKNKSVRNKS